MDDADYDSAVYYDDVVLDYRTPRLDSYSASPASQSQQQNPSAGLPLLQSRDWDEDLAYNELPPTCLHYSIKWQLFLKKGERQPKLTKNPEIEPDLVLAPGAYWSKSLRQTISDRIKENTPKGKLYEPLEVYVIVSVSDRAETNLSKRYPEFNINWEAVEKQLRTWSPLFRGGKKLLIDISFVTKQSAVMNTRSSTKRGATKRHHAEMEAEQEVDKAAGRTNHWNKVYAIMRCDGPPCNGDQCWRDPGRENMHFGLDGDVMSELVTYSEEGNKFEDQKDMPNFIRDLIYKKDCLNAERKEKSKKQKGQGLFSGNYPIQITNVLPGPPNQASPAEAAGSQPGDPDVAQREDEWSIPELRDGAISRYYVWHCARISTEDWKKSFKQAAQITLQQGLDLKHIYKRQSVDLFIEAGIVPGIADSWVQDVKQWVDAIKRSIVQ